MYMGFRVWGVCIYIYICMPIYLYICICVCVFVIVSFDILSVLVLVRPGLHAGFRVWVWRLRQFRCRA